MKQNKDFHSCRVYTSGALEYIMIACRLQNVGHSWFFFFLFSFSQKVWTQYDTDTIGLELDYSEEDVSKMVGLFVSKFLERRLWMIDETISHLTMKDSFVHFFFFSTFLRVGIQTVGF